MKRLLLGLLIVTLAGVGIWAWIEEPWKPSAEQLAKEEQAANKKAAPMPTEAELAKLSKEEGDWLKLKASVEEGAVGKDVLLNVTEKAQKTWEVNVDEAIYLKERTQIHLKTIEGTFFGDNGEARATFTAPYGKYDQTAETLQLYGGIELDGKAKDNRPGIIVNAQTLDWSKKEQDWLLTKGGVRMRLAGLGETRAAMGRFAKDMSEFTLSGGAETVLSGGAVKAMPTG